MTMEGLRKVKFQMKEHLALEGCHISLYESIDFTPKISMNIQSPRGDTDEKPVREYCFNGTWYSTPRKLLNAINKVIEIFAPQEMEEVDVPVLSKEDYEKFCRDAENMNVYDGRGTYDLYVCDEDDTHRVITTYVAKGVTPFVIKCRECGGAMKHVATYKNVSPGTKVVKWIRPTYSQYLKLSAYTRQHIEDGGLILETSIIDD